MLNRPDDCRGCQLDTIATGFTKPDGTGSLGVLIVGESAGEHEIRDGLPFRPGAPAGSLLQRAIERSGFDRSQFRISNVIQCQPPHNLLENQDFEVGAIEHCKVHREAVINAMKPRAILALGNVALRTLTGWSGEKRTVSYLRGYVLDSPYGPVIPSYHPSFLRRGAGHLFGVLCHDLRRAVAVAQQESTGTLTRAELDYRHGSGYFTTCPTPDTARQFLDECHKDGSGQGGPIAYDIETEDSQYRDEDADDDSDVPHSKHIVSIQFSTGRHSGIFMPWVDPYIAIAKAILALPNDKWGFNNWQFDDPLLKANGVVIYGVNHDLMWAWHHLQPDLPRGLQFVSSFYGYPFPWKHLAQSEPEFYGICDVESLHYIAPRIFDDLKRRGIWNGYDRHVLQLQPILLKMSERGLPVDPAAHAEFSHTLSQQRDALFLEMQQLVPDQLKPIEPRQGYKNPKIAEKAKLKPLEIGEQWIRRDFYGIAKVSSKESSTQNSRENVLALNRDVKDTSSEPEESVCSDNTRGDRQTTQRWCRLQPFTPSNQQLIQYMRFKGHKVPINFKSSKETTSKIELERLARSTKDILYSKVLEYRELSTLLTNHMKNWLPGDDGRVHTTFTFAPATGQLSSRAPNIQNSPKHTRLASSFKGMIIAKPSHVLLECVVPGTRILMQDLTWRSAGDLQAGDNLWGFDEFPVMVGKRPYSGIHKSTVLGVRMLSKPCMRLTTDKGVVECSVDHLWKTRTSGSPKWVRADWLKSHHQISFFTGPWNVDRSWEAGWLAGFMDGEGYSGNKKTRVLAFGQNPGLVSDMARGLFLSKGFRFEKTTGSSGPGRICEQFMLRGQAFGWVRALGMFRPIRLLNRAMENMEGMAYWGKNSTVARVLHTELIGMREVVAIETTTHTYIAEGLLSHNCDYRSFHALTLGFEAQDVTYMRLARLDIHSYLAAHMEKISDAKDCLGWSDADLAAFLADVKSKYRYTRDKKAKPAILGYGFGLKERHFYDMNREHFKDLKAARAVLAMLDDLFPKEVAYRKAVTREAHDRGYLNTRYGYTRYFYDVFHWDRKRSMMVPGEDHEAAIAFRPANDAFGMKKEAMLALSDENDEAQRYGLLNEIHDALLFECPSSLADEAIFNVTNTMEEPSAVLVDPVVAPDGLICRVSVSRGLSWNKMEEIVHDSKTIARTA